MKIAVISSSIFNIYGGALIERLGVEGLKPASVICAQKSKMVQLRNYVKKRGAFAALKKILEVSNIKTSKENSVVAELEKYGEKHHLEHWNRPLPALCRIRGIDYLRVSSINIPSTIDYVKERKIDLLLNAGGEILRKEIIDSSTYGVLNAHMGYLPSYRGFNVLEWSLFYGHQIGVTLHFVNSGIDTGDIIRFERIPVEAGDNIEKLRAKSFPINIDLMVTGIKELGSGRITRKVQEAGDGKQYFAMHPRLRAIAGEKIGTPLLMPEGNRPRGI